MKTTEVTTVLIVLAITGNRVVHGQCQSNKSGTNTEELLRIAENPAIDVRERAWAVNKLAERKDKNALPRLLKLLPNRYDLLTYRVIVLAEKFRDPTALPALKHYQELIRRDKIRISGRMNAVLEDAIQILEDPEKK